MEGWGPKSSVCPSKPRKSNFLGGISRNLAGISQRRPKSLRKKHVFNFWPLNLPRKTRTIFPQISACLTPDLERAEKSFSFLVRVVSDILRRASEIVHQVLPCSTRGLSSKRTKENILGEAFLLTVGAFLLTVKLLCLQSLKVLIRRTFPL